MFGAKKCGFFCLIYKMSLFLLKEDWTKSLFNSEATICVTLVLTYIKCLLRKFALYRTI